jgi:hypothetical protein
MSLALALALIGTGEARAHRLEADYRVLPGGRVQIESWFDLTGESPKGAKVQVFRPNGEILSEGQLDGKGLYVFSYTQVERLKIVVSAGAGHRKELDIPAADLAGKFTKPIAATALESNLATPSSTPAPFADRSPRVSSKDVIIGIAFLLALAAFVLSLRNARQLATRKDR